MRFDQSTVAECLERLAREDASLAQQLRVSALDLTGLVNQRHQGQALADQRLEHTQQTFDRALDAAAQAVPALRAALGATGTIAALRLTRVILAQTSYQP